jgi:drug/metabolite transporter (DMT)-like permease
MLRLSPSRLAGVLLVAAAALCWSIGGPFFRAIKTADDWTVACLRSAIMAVFLAAVLLAAERGRPARFVAVFRRAGWRGIVCGALFAVMMTCFMLAFARTTIANTMIIVAAGPFLAALLAWIVLGERVSGWGLALMALAFAGLAVMVAGDLGLGGMAGNALAFVIALATACNVVLLRGAAGGNMVPAVIVAGVLSALVALPFARFDALSARDLGILVILGVVQLGLGTALFVLGTRRLPAAEATLITFLDNVLGPFWTWLFHGERPTDHALVGGALVIGAVVAVTILGARARGAMPATPMA